MTDKSGTSHRFNRTQGTFITRVTFAVCILSILMFGCGFANRGSSSTTAAGSIRAKSAESDYSVRKHKWGVVQVGKESIRIGAFVPHCENTKAKPQVVRVERRFHPGAVVLTMFVRFPPKDRNCVGGQISVLQWVRVGSSLRHLDVYDGSVSPPARRREGK